ncbi:alpha/beta hydrolase [Rhizobium ruizarguesonis]
MRRVSFKNGSIDIAGALHLPDDFDEGQTYAALVIVTPGSSVKEQIGAIWGGRMAERGFIALAFDPSHQGESGGEPRDLEDPATRIEDVRCAVDYLMTLRYVGEERVGVLGICAGGGYAVSAAMTEYRFKAVGTVVAVNIGRARRQSSLSANAITVALEAVGRQRTAEARGGPARFDPWIPDDMEQAVAAGITDRDVLEAVAFYAERCPAATRTNRRNFRSLGSMMSFDAFHLVGELLKQPIQVIVGGRLGTTLQFEDGKQLFEQATNKEDLLVIDGAGHYDLYDKSEYVDLAAARLDMFYKRHLSQ